MSERRPDHAQARAWARLWDVLLSPPPDQAVIDRTIGPEAGDPDAKAAEAPVRVPTGRPSASGDGTWTATQKGGRRATDGLEGQDEVGDPLPPTA